MLEDLKLQALKMKAQPFIIGLEKHNY